MDSAWEVWWWFNHCSQHMSTCNVHLLRDSIVFSLYWTKSCFILQAPQEDVSFLINNECSVCVDQVASCLVWRKVPALWNRNSHGEWSVYTNSVSNNMCRDLWVSLCWTASVSGVLLSYDFFPLNLMYVCNIMVVFKFNYMYVAYMLIYGWLVCVHCTDHSQHFVCIENEEQWNALFLNIKHVICYILYSTTVLNMAL